MSNIFKSNSRFSALVDNLPAQKKENKKEYITESENKEKHFNSFKSERPKDERRRDTSFRPYDEKERERQKQESEEELKAAKELKEKEKERLKQESLKIKNFPDLVDNSKKNNNNKNSLNYIEKFKFKDEIKVENNKNQYLENLKPGWVLIKKDKTTGNTIMKYGPEVPFSRVRVKTEREIGIDIINALVKLHQKRTEKYIKNYGYDEWERMFKFPDWREQEAWLEEMKELENEDNVDYEDIDEEECLNFQIEENEKYGWRKWNN
jgi:hypothetical protein